MSNRRLLPAILAVLLLSALGVSAQGTVSTVAPEKQFARFELENGLEVVVVENHLVPLATIELAVRNGSFTEGPEYAGLSHLYEHMFFKANSVYPTSQDFISELGRLGALYNATTREEVVNYYFTLPVENLDQGMEVMSIAVRTPLFKEVELEREKEVVLGEFDRHESNPFFPFNREMDNALWGDVVTRKQPIGQREVIKSATPAKMRAIQKKYYIPNNSVLMVAGDVDSAVIHQMAVKYFGEWEQGPDPFAEDAPPRAEPLDEKKLVMVPAAGVDIAQVEYSWHGPSIGIDDEATYAADVLIFILQQPQSRFQRRLVESGVAQAAGINYYTQRYVGPISAQVVTTPDKIRKAIEVFWAELQELDSPDYFTDEELETAKQILRIRHIYESEETTDWIHTLGFWWSTTGLEYFRGYLDNLSKVTRADIQEYIRNYIKGKDYVLGISSNRAALERLALSPGGTTIESEVLR